jgi:DNA polymerase-3 subunit gamma/tau
MDAATHGLVDDARELRDKALFAPVQSRYKIYIIDEAHQLGPAAANALLKIVEEPPPYVIFIFATTEPEKVIPTIRSRTHHYQFRLVGPETLKEHLVEICQREGVTLDEGALSLAARAGSGSVRDTLSALGQLINGAIDGKVSYESALQLLSHTSNESLRQTIRGLLNHNAGALLGVVGRVLETGGDPRRFTTDLLDHMRDLMVLSASNGDKKLLLRSYTDEELVELASITGAISISDLISMTEIVADHLVRLRGANSPQINLETMMMRLLQTTSTPSARETGQVSKRIVFDENPVAVKNTVSLPEMNPQVPKVTKSPSVSRVPLSDLKSLEGDWPRVLEGVKNRRRLTWTLLSTHAFPVSLESGVVKVALPSAGALDSFERSNSRDVLLGAMKEVFEGEFEVEMIVQSTRPSSLSQVQDADLSDSVDQSSGEELLMKALGAQIISKEDQ